MPVHCDVLELDVSLHKLTKMGLGVSQGAGWCFSERLSSSLCKTQDLFEVFPSSLCLAP